MLMFLSPILKKSRNLRSNCVRKGLHICNRRRNLNSLEVLVGGIAKRVV